MTDLIAVNVLLEPDQATLARAGALNDALHGSFPSGFAFDDSHHAHATVVQRYVRRDDLSRLFGAVADSLAGAGIAGLRLQAVGLVSGRFGTPPGTALASIELEPSPTLTGLQAALVEAIAPFGRRGGAGEAFFRRGTEAAVNDETVAYVEDFVPARTAERYSPHISVGVGTDELVAELQARPFEAFDVIPVAVGVYQLGDLGTARARLHSWMLDPEA